MQARMKEVAIRAGVSTQTVSRVLRNSSLVTAPTAARVRAAMRELGYHGNEMAGALKRGQTRTLGLLLPFLGMPFWSDVASGAEEMAHSHGCSLLLCDSSRSIRKEADYLALLLSHRVAGIIYAPRGHAEMSWECQSLVASETPVVVISADLHDLPYCHVRTDDVRAGYVAVRHLLDLGRRRIALVGAVDATPCEFVPAPDAAMCDRLAGARQALQEAGLAARDIRVCIAPFTVEGGFAAGVRLLEEPGRLPDGIFVTNDIVALGILEAFRARDISVPSDCAVVAHDGLRPATAIAVPALTTIAPPSRAMGQAAVELILQAQNGESLPLLHLLEAELIVRESTIGIDPAIRRRRLCTPISQPEAWSGWRTQMAGESVLPPTPSVDSMTLADWYDGARKEVNAATT